MTEGGKGGGGVKSAPLASIDTNFVTEGIPTLNKVNLPYIYTLKIR